ncbi:MAG: hypothetical protein M3Z29_11915, partial [Pseudomonadota bacterium]|nr:hypothetical protein [Pseudomonadota bacterium]
RPDLGAQGAGELKQVEAAAHGSLGVVLVGGIDAEDGKEAVSGVLQHRSALCLDDSRRAGQRVVHDAADLFGVEVLRQSGRADDVEKEDADLSETLRRRDFDGLGRRSADGSEPCAGGREQTVDGRVPQYRALRF